MPSQAQWKVRFSAVLALAVALASQAVVAQEPPVAEPEPTGIEAVEPAEVAAARTAVWPALVNIAVVSQSFSEGRAVRYPSAGSGVVVTPEGHVLTNYHVAGEAVRITCTLTDGRVLRARVVTDDPLTDLSVLRLEAPPGAPPFAFAALGDSDRLETGDPVIAMGNPLALASSVTLGIVSNPHRVFTDFAGTRLENLELGGSPTGVFTRWIQHDALILPGNSGGPLVDLDGRVVGINELGGGFGFAIPSNIAAEVLRQAIASGEVRRGWLGFSVLPVTKLGRERGALVSSVLPGSPAERAGLAPGDILLALGGEPVDVRFLEQIPVVYQRAAALAPGDRVELTVERHGAETTLSAEVEAMPPARGEEGEVTALGLTLQEVTEPLALLRGLPDAEGLLVTGVRPGYPAAEARPPLAADDVLLAVAGQRLGTLAAAERAVAGDGAEHRLLAFRRGKAEMVTAVDLDRDVTRRRWGGALPQPWLGIGTQVLTPDIAEALGVAGTTGFRVTRIYPGTAAERAGLVPGDLLVGLDGEPLTASRPQEGEDLRREIEARAVGEAVLLTVRSAAGGANGAEGGSAGSFAAPREVEVELEPEPPEPTDADRIRQDELGFAVREMAFTDRADAVHPPPTDGMMVVEVTPGGWAHVAGLDIGDVILDVQGRPVPDAARFEAAIAAVLAERPEVLRLFVQRGPRTHFVFIEPDWPPPPEGDAAGGKGPA